MSTDLRAVGNAIASKFIARTDTKAVQVSSGAYIVHTTDGKRESPRLPWNREALEAHLEGRATYGHYMLSKTDQCKLIAFDIDLIEAKPDKGVFGYYLDESGNTVEFDPRSAWLDRAHPARSFLKLELKMCAAQIAQAVSKELEIPVACAYSGGKGVHVYGFTGPMLARDVRLGAQVVLDTLDLFEPLHGQNFYQPKDKTPGTGYPNISLEIFPKQDSLSEKDLGNLMRLPMGRNLKSSDPTFFFDFTSPMAALVPCDPLHALNVCNPWKRPDETAS